MTPPPPAAESVESAPAPASLREGGLRAPVRHPHDRASPSFFDPAAIEAEMERVFDVCHGCRRCLALCDSFPKLFDLVDATPGGEVEEVDKARYGEVAEACTLCDMCFMASCPYVPPHEFNIDFPHLITRWRAAERKRGVAEPKGKALTRIDRNAALASLAPWLANWGSARGNWLGRTALRLLFGVHAEAELPAFARRRFTKAAAKKLAKAPAKEALSAPAAAPAQAAAPASAKAEAETAPAPVPASVPATAGPERKVVVYATCFVENHHTETGHAAMALFAANGVEAVPVYPACCGMPRLERGDLDGVAKQAERVSAELLGWVEKGYEVVALTPSCALMLKFEWPQILPDSEAVRRLADATWDVSEYFVALHKAGRMKTSPRPLEGGVFLHVACHARAQNVGFKARDLLKLIPETELKFSARCSGHGGLWGSLEENFETAHRIGKPVARQIAKAGAAHLASECPLAGMHLVQGVERLGQEASAGKGDGNKDGDKDGDGAVSLPTPERAFHPVVLYAKACGLEF